MRKDKVGITGIGSYLPERVLTNADLEKMVDTSNDWIISRTGIETRRIADADQASSDLAAEAARRALADGGLDAGDLELLIIATATPDMPIPATACIVQEKIGAYKAACFDLNAACTGWIYGMDIAWQFIRNGRYGNALVVGAEKLTAITDWEDRNTCVLFGDGAGATLIGRSSDGGEILSSFLGADGRFVDLLYMPGGGSRHPATHETVDKRMHYMKMEGREVFKQAVAAMANCAEIALGQAGIDRDRVKYFIPHQANMRIMKAVARKLKVPFDKIFVTIDHCGNISAASIPVALSEAVSTGALDKGDTVCFVAFGGGFTWGALVATL